MKGSIIWVTSSYRLSWINVRQVRKAVRDASSIRPDCESREICAGASLATSSKYPFEYSLDMFCEPGWLKDISDMRANAKMTRIDLVALVHMFGLLLIKVTPSPV